MAHLSMVSVPRRTDPVSESTRLLAGTPRLLYTDPTRSAVVLGWYDLQTEHDVDWKPVTATHTLTLVLNLGGQGSIRVGQSAFPVGPGMAAIVLTGMNLVTGVRERGQHQFVIAEFSPGYLRETLSACDGALDRRIEEFIAEKAGRATSVHIRRLSPDQNLAVRRLAQPPVYQGARGLWYKGQVFQLMAEFFFERRGEDELFCDRHKRVARERVQRVIAMLKRDLTNPPTLEMIGREVGCSPFHLSRTFSQEAGVTIPQYLRKLRMEKAAGLLRQGKHNVTEAALAVGYSSISHFSQAFCQTVGCCPGLYPLKTATRRQQFASHRKQTGSNPDTLTQWTAADEPQPWIS